MHALIVYKSARAHMLRWTLLTRCFSAPLEEGQQHLAPCRHSPPDETCGQPAFPPTTTLPANTTARCDVSALRSRMALLHPAAPTHHCPRLPAMCAHAGCAGVPD